MNITSVAELDTLVAAYREKWLQDQAAKTLERNSYDGTKSSPFVPETLYGYDLTVARLFTSSPPKDTYTVANDIDYFRDTENTFPETQQTIAGTHSQQTEFNQRKQQQNNNVTKPENIIRGSEQTQGSDKVPVFGGRIEVEPLVFKRRAFPSLESSAVENTGQKKQSLISQYFAGNNAYGMPPITGPSLKMKIFFPQQRIDMFEEIEVSLESTIDQCIKRFLEYHVRKVFHEYSISMPSFSQYASVDESIKVKYSSACYQLKEHAENGVPVDDLPSLEPTSLIREYFDEAFFTEEGTAVEKTQALEYCLCTVEGYETIPDDPSLTSLIEALKRKYNLDKQEGTPERAGLEEKVFHKEKQYIDDLSEAVGKVQGGYALKILLPYSNPYTILPVTESMRAYELFAKIRSKQFLPLFTDEYEFVLQKEDRVALSRISDTIDMNSVLYTEFYCKGVRTIELRRKIYADSPSYKNIQQARNKPVEENDLKKPENIRGKQKSAQKELTKVDPGNFIFNDFTASKYQEWNVIKTNKWSKRQKRVFGVDCQKIYNKLRSPKQHKANTKHSERLVSDILDAQFIATRPGVFRILYRKRLGPGNVAMTEGTTVLEYEAEDGPEAAAEIISKIQYIRKHM